MSRPIDVFVERISVPVDVTLRYQGGSKCHSKSMLYFYINWDIACPEDCMCVQRKLRSVYASAHYEQSSQSKKIFKRTAKTDLPDLQDDLNLRCAHMQSCRKRCASAHILETGVYELIHVHN